MHGFYRLIKIPEERNANPLVLSIILQATTVLAIVTVVRETHPDPMADREQWERMGMLAEFLGLAPAIMLVAFAAVTGLFCLLCREDRPPIARARVVVAALACGTLLLDPGLLALAARTGLWPMFGGIAAVITADCALTFLALRWLDGPTPAAREAECARLS